MFNSSRISLCDTVLLIHSYYDIYFSLPVFPFSGLSDIFLFLVANVSPELLTIASLIVHIEWHSWHCQEGEILYIALDNTKSEEKYCNR